MSFFEDEKYNFPYISKTFSEKKLFKQRSCAFY